MVDLIEVYELIAELKIELEAAQLDIFVDDTQLKINKAEEWLLTYKNSYEALLNAQKRNTNICG